MDFSSMYLEMVCLYKNYKKKESAFICACSSLEPGRGLVLMCIGTDMVYECLDAVWALSKMQFLNPLSQDLDCMIVPWGFPGAW